MTYIPSELLTCFENIFAVLYDFILQPYTDRANNVGSI